MLKDIALALWLASPQTDLTYMDIELALADIALALRLARLFDKYFSITTQLLGDNDNACKNAYLCSRDSLYRELFVMLGSQCEDRDNLPDYRR